MPLRDRVVATNMLIAISQSAFDTAETPRVRRRRGIGDAGYTAEHASSGVFSVVTRTTASHASARFSRPLQFMPADGAPPASTPVHA